jgi:superfamily I DNA/RNA helicase
MAKKDLGFLKDYLSQFDGSGSDGFEPSKYQKVIYEWVKNGEGNAMVNAVAGSGKTTTLIKSLDCIPPSQSKLFVAFNKHIADSLSKKIGRKAICKTVHSLGLSMIRQYLGGNEEIKIDNHKFTNRIKQCALALRQYADETELSQIESTLNKALHFCMVTLTNPKKIQELFEMINYYQVDISPNEIDAYSFVLTDLLEYSSKKTFENKTIIFDEMLYLPYIWNVVLPEKYKFDFILCDEAQDLSKAQLHTVMMHKGDNTRLMFVGDKFQSIYGFTGANPNSFKEIGESINATYLPLSICYRCPVSHIELAKQIVPEIEASPNANEGNIELITVDRLCEIATAKDLIICRSTAPLIELAFYLIKKGIPAKVKGKDIAKSLIGLANNISKIPGFDFDNFEDFAEIYKSKQIKKAAKNPSMAASIQDLLDKIDCLKQFLKNIGITCYSVSDFQFKLEGLFTDDSNTITLSTVHRAKGLEAENVFIIRSDKMPLVWQNQQEWQLQQEVNLQYVAYTRSTNNLYFVKNHE